MSIEFTPDGEKDVDFEYPDTLLMAEAAAHFAGDAQAWLFYWCERLGQGVDGSAFTIGDGGGIAILELASGKWMTPEQIVRQEREGKRLRSV